MPRVQIKRKEYKASDLTAYIVNTMYEKKIRQSKLAEALHISQQAVSYKIKTAGFDYKELLTVFECLRVPDEDILKIMRP